MNYTELPKEYVGRLLERMDAHTETIPFSGCYVWMSSTNAVGYGKIQLCFRNTPSTHYVHRIAYELARGPIPDGLQIDHRCRVPSCWNPDHLEVVTAKENSRRRVIRPAKLLERCKRGHLLSPENIYLEKGTRRHCLLCKRVAAKIRKAKAGAAR